MRNYKGENFECDAPDDCCLFCKNCTDIFWDYTNGPYLFLGDGCDGDWRNCNKFEAEEKE